MEHKDLFLIESIIEYCDRIIKTSSLKGADFEAFKNDLDFQDVCAFRIEQIGELVKSLSDIFKASHPEVEWNKIVGFRNIIAHDYGSVDEWLAWTIVSKDIPNLRDFCVTVIK